MRQGALRLPAGFIAITVVLLLTGSLAVAFPHTPVPKLQLFLPAMYLTTLLIELATYVLLSIVFSKTRDPSLAILATMFLACGFLDGASFLLIPLPGQPGALLFPGNASSPYLFVAWHAVLAVGAFAYALERGRPTELTPAQVRTMMVVGRPVAVVLILAAIATIVALTLWMPSLSAGADLTAFRHSFVAFVDVPMTLVALIALGRLIGTGKASGIDFAVFLAAVSSLVIVLISVAPIERFSAAWFTGRSLYCVSSTFVFIMAIRDLIDRMSASLRIEADALRLAATNFRDNAAVEVSLVKSRFVAMVSHELRTPLSGIIGMAELLERSSLSDRQRSWTQAVRSSAHSLLRIVNDLLDFSRVESGSVEFEEAPFELAQMVEDVAALFREPARERGVALHAFIDPILPRTISGDQTRIKQVLQNLVNNAVRFTDAGSIRIEVAPDTTVDTTYAIRFTVHDTGIGIGRNAQERIFNAFSQEDASTARRFGGTGLGLAIARHLVQLMGGRLTVRSVIGVGSTFAFALPLRSVSANPDLAPPLRNVRVIVVESEPTIRALLERYVDAWEMSSEIHASTADVRAAGAAWLPGEGRCDILLVGPGIATGDAVDVARDLRGGAMLGGGDAILIRGEHISDEPCPPGFDAMVAGPMRQSTIFNAIVRLRRHGFIENQIPPINGVAPRRPRRERVLVAEDDAVNQALLVAQLDHLGLRADVVTDGAAAVQAALTQSYDLIFMDCHMPEIDGFEAARRIRRGSTVAGHIPIIAVTANVMPGNRDVCLAAGMDDFLPKPALIDPLARIIDRWLPQSSTGRTASAPASAPAAAPAEDAEPEGAADMRRRLREIFHGDETRVAATLALALGSLREGAEALNEAVAARDAAGAGRIAHKLKGVAVEVGFASVGNDIRALERSLHDGDWDAVAGSYADVSAAIERDAVALTQATR